MSVFDSLVGQDRVVGELRRAIAASAERPGGGPGFTHAWLFTGPPGSGRSVAARAFAAALACPDGGCGRCEACHTSLAGTHADLTVVTPAGLSIGIAEARQIVRSAALAPATGRWHVVLIEDADRLTEGAANALLKAIEEPSPYGVFLLCVPSADDLPLTIRSRCRLVVLRTPAPAAVAAMLTQRDGVDPAMAAFAARAAQGHVGRARRLATDEQARRERRDVLTLPAELSSVGVCFEAAAELVRAATEDAARVSEPLDAAETAALREALGETGGTSSGTGRGRSAGGTLVRARGTAGVVKDLEKKQKSRETRLARDTLDRALVDLAAFYRDVLLVQTGAHEAGVELVHVDLADQVARLARAVGPEGTLGRLEAVLACREAIAANVAPLLAVERMALALRTG